MSESYILIVDNEEEERDNIRDLLELEGYQVDTCDTAEEAHTFVEQRLPDLVLLDVLLPGSDGLELLRILKEKYPSLPVLAVSASTQEEICLKVNEYGVDTLVYKPYEQEQLLKLINSQLTKV